MRDTICRRPKTWRADLDTLRRAVQTLAATDRAKDVSTADAIGFVVEKDPDWIDDNEEHVEQGMTVYYEHDCDPVTGRR